MIAKIIFEDDHIVVYHRPAKASLTLITFSNFGFNYKSGQFWGEKFVQAEDWECFGFVAKSNNWFPYSSVFDAVQHCKIDGSKPVVAYGHSLGGYAAIKYSRLLNATRVVAGAPQYSINPRIVPEDHRFTGNFNPILNMNMEIETTDISGDVIIVADPFDTLDLIHLNHIKRACPPQQFIVFPIHYIGHNVMEILSNRSLTRKILLNQVIDFSDQNLITHARTTKKYSSSYCYNIVKILISKNKIRSAVSIIKFLDVQPMGGPPGMMARYQFIASKALLKSGRYDQAITYATKAHSIMKEDLRFQFWMAICLAHAEQWLEAQSIVTTITSMPQKPREVERVSSELSRSIRERKLPEIDITI